MERQIRLSEDVPAYQRDHLERALTASPPHLAALLRDVAQDPDIRAGEEPLHPQWLEAYERFMALPELRRTIPPSIVQQIRQFFEPLDAIDSEVRNVDPADHRITFLLGAGASKPEPSGIPTVQELLPDLLNRAKRLDRDDVTRLADFCEQSRITNIEDLLTAAQLADFCSRSPDVLHLLDFLLYGEVREPDRRVRRASRSVNLSSVAFLQDTLQVLFGLLSSRMLPAEPNAGHEAIAAYSRANASTAVVTTNYDCCVDLALGRADRGFTYGIDFANPPDPPDGTSDSIPLLKLHGSLNWFYCETCQEVHLIDIERTIRDFREDRGAYPVIAICRQCGGQRRGLLVPPLAMKFEEAPPLTPLIGQAAKAFEEADIVVVVGFSFAEADRNISRMLSKWMQRRPKARMIVFDPDREVGKRVSSQFSRRIPDFDASRILRVVGDAAETLPAFLTGEMLKVRSKRKRAASKRETSGNGRKEGEKGARARPARASGAKGE